MCDFLLVISSNVGRILHRLAIVHPWRTDNRRTDDNHDNSSTVTKVRSAENWLRACFKLPFLKRIWWEPISF